MLHKGFFAGVVELLGNFESLQRPVSATNALFSEQVEDKRKVEFRSAARVVLRQTKWVRVTYLTLLPRTPA